MNVRGMPQLTRTIGLMASAVSSPRPVFEAALRPVKPAGFPNVIIRKPYTFEVAIADKFRTGGRNALDQRMWTEYQNERKYAEYKARRGGGTRVGLWNNSKRPLVDTFVNPNNPDHVEWATDAGFGWGSKRSYARDFSDGGVYQKWDGILTPEREVIVVNDQLAMEIARGFQRYVSYSLMVQGRAPSDFGLLRVEP
jgi:hypothetical protein